MKRIGDVNQVELFHVYAHFAGDVERVAFQAGLTPAVVAELADHYGWAATLKKVTASNTASGSELQRSINRATNYIQSHRLREMVDRLLTHFTADPQKLLDLVTVNTMKGSYTDMSPVVNLVKAAEIAQNMTYRSLGDSMEVTVKDGNQDGGGGRDLAGAMIKAMEAADRTPGLSSVTLLREAIASEGAVAPPANQKRIGGVPTP